MTHNDESNAKIPASGRVAQLDWAGFAGAALLAGEAALLNLLARRRATG